ncbi:Asp23/Gls24 family envelope stress response protein [Arthrobacter sp. H35-D1]|uniref:Asp23/Gls24 family envelope stress response protein n=1 Tax=Arthrobacter sp. H35-D1 TaxID=3046202 RepID=UPI0024BBBC25|nr:Asp23/Gls24 family envelope stress response protein [Arthrobacter sp. H35-D1]MDJ0315253.1 Asp23/Gls24 family envelope stress response protein [Arthrobacter sp. H35-D1]
MAESPKTPGTSSGIVPTPEEQKHSAAQQEQPKKHDALHTDRGDTSIEETVVQKLAGMATREVPGVYAMGSSGRRAFSAITERIPGSQTNVSGGVSVEKGERQTAIDVSIVVEYGVSIVEISQGIRRNVIQSVEHVTGLEVIEVNVNVTDVHLPEEDQHDQQNQQERKTELQ